MTAAPGRSAAGRVGLFARSRVRQGSARVRSAWPWVAQAAGAGMISYALGLWVLGHPAPFFAPITTWLALGFTANREVRKVAELSVGVAIGVAAGDLVVHLIGSGIWQLGLVLFVAALLGRFLDRSALVTTQAGVQAIVIVGLPAIGGGPFGRWLDAVAGGLVALAVVLLWPTDPVRRPQALARSAVGELGRVLHTLARGLDAGSSALVEEALLLGRATQPALDDWLEATRSAHELAKVAPSARRRRDELDALVDAAVRTDRAVRNARVLARRSAALLAGEHDLARVAEDVRRAAAATDELAAALGAGRVPERARADLLALGAGLDPFAVAADDWQVQSLVLLLRSLVVDLLEAAGVPQPEAAACLPRL